MALTRVVRVSSKPGVRTGRRDADERAAVGRRSNRPWRAGGSCLGAETVDCFAPGGDLILAARPLGIVNESAP